MARVDVFSSADGPLVALGQSAACANPNVAWLTERFAHVVPENLLSPVKNPMQPATTHMAPLLAEAGDVSADRQRRYRNVSQLGR
ncbi:hypothetical protein PD5205_03667 [Xanthomonas fragariae]|uniref:Uncharacterized protein n=1 Tax=Xanthomonas fragariae TaxID=48664 RepID=A0A1Y6H4W2_9XANT|nr:hypothetical protein O1K_10102 [Xanthomonas fragariae LMG 25863]SMQ96882.1 hypothetical protein NBC2815_03564 [Xanthomonas fragariae]SMQ97596.1 hypothetical protein PD885_00326 [Xanthomonas fragariae]SMR04941.1 hypothetical protein PD5205_03667 [Xanthomonas fragariae]